MSDFAKELEVALDAVRAAGEVVMRWFGTDMEVHHKSVDQPVTAADLEADALLRERLLAADPACGWLSEETADNPERLQRERVWIVDPIDGTRSFIAGRREFAISVALAVHGRAVLGIVSNPASAELYWSLAGGGAYRQRAGGEPEPLEVASPDARTLLASRSEIRRGEFEPFDEEWLVVPTGSTACKLALVAAGEGAAFISRGPKSEWDVCAGALIVQEAGGVVSDLAGRAFEYNRADPLLDGVVAGTREAHGLIMARALPRVRREPRAESREPRAESLEPRA